MRDEEAGESTPTEPSFQQQQYWVLSQAASRPGACHTVYAVRLRGPLSLDSLREAVHRLVRRHDIFRTIYRDEGDGLKALPNQHAKVDVSARDWQPGEGDFEDWAGRQIAAEARQPFDLARHPPLRCSVYRNGGQSGILALIVHHIATDGISFHLLWNSLRQCHDSADETAVATGHRYSQYGARQRSRLDSQRLDAMREFWHAHLKGGDSRLDLPFDKEPDEGRGVAQVFMEIPKLVHEALREIARANRCSENVLYLAAYFVWLSRYTGQGDISIGLPVSLRPNAVDESVIGCCINTLCLRQRLDPGRSFSAILHSLRDTLREAMAHAEYPIQKLTGELGRAGGGRRGLFQTLFQYRNFRRGLEPLGSCQAELLPLTVVEADFPLILDVLPNAHPASVTMLADAGRFSETAVSRMLRHYIRLLESIATAPDGRIGGLQLWEDGELDPIRTALTRVATDCEDTLHGLFETQSRANPNAVAIRHNRNEWTYAELVRRSDRLAARLIATGLQMGDPVGVCLPRSADLICALLGVLKAGGACLPIDRNLPADRISLVLDQARPRVVVGTKTDLATISYGSVNPTLVDITDIDERTGGDGRQHPAVKAGDLCYVLYTSGSTGAPKGVAMEHRAIVNLVRWQCRESSDRPVTLQFAPPAFDVSFQEVFSTLAAGGTLILIDETDRLNPDRIVDLAAAQRITRMFLPPAYLDPLAAAAEKTALPNLREVIVAGERLSISPGTRRFFGRHPAARLVNQYGPTETHVVASHTLIGPPESWPDLPPIGRSVPGAAMLILDREGNLAPMTVAGELCVAGVCMARGYWRNPAESGERFRELTNLFDRPVRIYRTGDFARMDADGTFRFLGRMDRQLKIRGHRVEPDEVEAVLRRHPGVSGVAVVAGKTDAGGTVLSAYWSSSDAPVHPTELRDLAARSLPDYMIPAAWFPVTRMPLTANGKIDRDAVVRQNSRPVAVRSDHIPPQSPLERTVAQIWSELLDVGDVGREDNFFELGGHSLIAIRCIFRLRRDSKTATADIRELFRFPILADFARCLERGVPADSAGASPVAAPRTSETCLTTEAPATWAQVGVWLHSVAVDQPQLYLIKERFLIRGPLDRERLEGAFQELIRRHDSLRAVFRESNGRLLMRIRDQVDWRLERVDLEQLPAADRARFEKETLDRVASDPFVLDRDPLLRAVAIRRGPEEHVLGLTVHHLVVDGFSLVILFRQLGELYQGGVDGGTSVGGSKEPMFLDYAKQLASFNGHPDHQRNREYWRGQMNPPAGDAGILADISQPRRGCGSVEIARRTLPKELHSGVAQFARDHQVTKPMVLLAAVFALLRHITGKSDLMVGSPVEGRSTVAAENMVGMFVDTLPLRVRCRDHEPFSSLVHRVAEIALSAYAHYPVSLDALMPEEAKDGLGVPTIPILFVYQAQGYPVLTLKGLEIERWETNRAPAKFPVSIYAVPVGETTDIRFHFDSGRHRIDRIRFLIDHLVNLLENVIAEPEIAIDQINLLSPDEARAVTEIWSRNETGYPRERTVGELFDEQVRQHPDTIALTTEAEQLTYSELSDRSARLAVALANKGTVSGQRIGICLERSPEMIVGMLAILRCGAVYVPIDPEYPAERMSFMAEDAEVAGVLTSQSCHSRLRHAGIDAWRTEDLLGESNLAAEPPAVAATEPACLMYTSGTTGQPNGSLVSHRGIVRLVKNTDYASFDSDHVFLQLASISFDAATFEVWGPLLNGGRLVLMPPGPTSVADIGAAIRTYRVTTLWLTAGLFHLVVDEAIDILKPLRQLLAGGDVLSPAHVARVRWELPDLKLVNGYGPTENTTFSCCYHVGDDFDSNASIPIGKPIANSETFILDERQRPAPIGVPGELYLGGDGLSLGYWKRPELDAERFHAHPFRNAPHARLYRTGDVARFLPDGNIEFLGRCDAQVKIRGFRVEPAEIESVVDEHSAVAHCSVFLNEESPSRKSIGVALVLRDSDRTVLEELKQSVRRQLPGHLVPGIWLPLESLPLTANGKVDRRELDRLAQQRTTETRIEVSALTPLESELLAIWQRVLARQNVDCEANFFASGGDSLLAMRLVAELERRLDRRIPLNQLFRHPTVRSLARSLETGAQTDSTLVPLKSGAVGNPLYVLHGWGGEVFGQVDLIRQLPEELTVVGIQAVEHAGENERLASFESMGRRYAEDICRHQPDGPYFLCGFSLGGMIAFETARQLQGMGKQIGRLIILDTFTPNLPRHVYYRAMAPHFMHRTLHHLRGAAFTSEGIGRYLKGRVSALRRQLRGNKSTPTDSRPPDKRRVTGDYYEGLWRGYVPQAADLPVTLFQSRDNRRALAVIWEHLSGQPVKRHWYEGKHVDTLRSEELGRMLGRELAGL